MTHALRVIDTLRQRLSTVDYDKCFALFDAVREHPNDTHLRHKAMYQLLHIVSTDLVAYGDVCDYLCEHEPNYIALDPALEQLLESDAL